MIASSNFFGIEDHDGGGGRIVGIFTVLMRDIESYRRARLSMITSNALMLTGVDGSED